jgi:Domain of unknown function (DUF4372)/FG-GAP-like repeat
MAFAQLTYRESLRDIESCLRALQSKLYHMGFRGKVSRSTFSRRERIARQAYLRRFRAGINRDCARLRSDESRSASEFVCSGLHGHRPAPVVGTFVPGPLIPTNSRPTGLAVGDFNNDGRLDLVVGGTSPSELTIMTQP